MSVLKQAIVRPAGDEEEFAFADDVPTENSTVHDDVATESANDVLTSPEASAVNAHTSDEQPQADIHQDQGIYSTWQRKKANTPSG
ncbi:translocase subunit [Cutibacterium acnes JCM 18918]|nr:translocase subunit [Cutibacterium acnes JCM 18918]